MGKVLIVDDAKFLRMTIARAITKAGHEVIGEAQTGEEAVQLYKNLKPDLVFMDFTMPDMDGIEAVKHIKKDFPDAKIIMCSAMGQHKMVLEAIEAGARDFIVKPFEESRIIEAIDKHIS